MKTKPLNNSPAELVAIANAAHKTGDTELKTAALCKLRDEFGIKLTFGTARKIAREAASSPSAKGAADE